MFVFPRESLPKDPVFPADLEKLGYFINDNDQIKMISDPSKDFMYKINANERYNEMQKEAMNVCIRDIVLSRLHSLGLETLRLPIGASPKSQHVPILVSPGLETKSRIIVVFGEPAQDLGIWAYRTIGHEGINMGSAVDFASAVLKGRNGIDAESTGLIITNPGQLVWYCGGGYPMSLPTWNALPRESAVDAPLRMTYRNSIPGNENWREHINYVFEEVLGKMTSKDSRIDIIGLAEGGLGAIQYLAENFSEWKHRISALCISNPVHTTEDFHTPEFSAFIATRCRAYQLSESPLNQPIRGSSEFGCGCFSSGEQLNAECIMPKAWKAILEWLTKLHADKDYKEVQVMFEDEKVEEDGFRVEGK
ncbi:hypothetical protein FQN54_003539 [Arachnomyces sp. PD_36]|nr:hypothetical protein FQN54_003539 [Arachnomyces sp. PD_36]